MSSKTIPLWEPEISGNEWKYVKECLETRWVSSAGPFVDQFEDRVRRYVGTRHAVAVVNGTAALHLLLQVSGIGVDDEVVMPVLTFIAPANAVRYCGGWPYFIDADPETWQMDIGLLTEFLERQCGWKEGVLRNKSTGRRVKAILPVHILGHPTDMDPVLALAKKFNLKVIEDATESLGALYKGRKAGSLGDAACFSFNGNKLLTTGGGGMIVTDDEAVAKRARYLSTQAKDDPLEYVHHEIGYNYRLTNLQAAVGCAQMERLEEFVEKKQALSRYYREGLAGIDGVACLPASGWARPTDWLFTIRIDEGEYGMSSRELMKCLAEKGVQSRPLWTPLHRDGPYQGAGDFPVAERLHRECLSLPSSVGLARKDQESIISLVFSKGGR